MASPEKPKKLIARLETLDDSERLGTLARHALHLDDEHANRLMDLLARGGVRARRLGLLAAATRRDLSRIRQGLDDPSVSVRQTAAGLFGRYADKLPDALIADLDEVTLRAMTASVVRYRRPSATGLLTSLLERGRLTEAARVLSVCPSEVILRHLDSVPWPHTIWRRLAQYAPDIALGTVERAFASSTRPDLVWDRFDASFWHALAQSRADAVRRLVEQYADAHVLPTALYTALTPLARAVPDRVIAWLAARAPSVTRPQLPPALLKRLRTVDDPDLERLCAGLVRRDAGLLAHLLCRLPHARRGALFDRAISDWNTARTSWPAALLEVLPDSTRDREAARMLELEPAKTDAAWRRTLLGFRLIDHARSTLLTECSSAQAEDRQQAYDALIRSTGRTRRGMAETLAFLRRTKNEQDPVRMAVLAALAAVPVRLFESAEALDAVVSPIFEARDTSYGTRSQASRLAHRLLVGHAATPASPLFALGLSILERLAGHSGTLGLPALHPNLPRGAERSIVEAVGPWLKAAEKREQIHVLNALWRALGKRAWRVPELGERVAYAVWKGPKNNAGYAASLWLEDPSTRDERVRELLRGDASAIYLHAVTMHCHGRRQTLLAARFDSKPHRGRFHPGRVVPVPIFRGGLLRWTDDLEAKYEALLRAALAEPKRFSTHRSLLLHALGRLPKVTVEQTMAAVRPDDVVELEAALGSLVWNDAPRSALPILLAHLDGDRARVAAYALARLARLMPAAQVVDALAGLLAGPPLRVTVHKEVVRLLGRYPTAKAVALLEAEWRKELHRDVRIAALHAARSVLSEPGAWEILSAASTDASPDVARAVVDVFAQNVSETFQARYLGIMAATADHVDPTVRRALFLALRSWFAAAPDGVVDLAARVAERLDHLDPWNDVLDRLVDGARSPATHDRLVRCVERLRTAAEADIEPAGERDQLSRRRVASLVDRLTSIDRSAAVLDALDRVGAALLPSPTLWHHGAAARLAAASNDRLGAAVAAVVEQEPASSHERAVALALERAARCGSREWTAGQALAVVAELLGGGTPMRRLAVPLVAGFGALWGWGEEWTTPLGKLRHDDDLGARTAALEVIVG